MFLFIEEKRFKSFSIENNGIYYKNKFYNFEEILDISFERIHTTQYTMWIKQGECEMASMIISLTNGAKVSLSFNESYFFIGSNIEKKKWINALIETYSKLSFLTFKNRLSRLESQLEKLGYFEFSGAKFFPKSMSIESKGKFFVVGKDKFIKSYGKIDFLKENESFLVKLLRICTQEIFPSKRSSISTLVDTDVIFYILKSKFGLHWNA